MAIIVQRTNSIGGLGNSWNSIFDHNKTAKQTVALIACLLSFFHSNTFDFNMLSTPNGMPFTRSPWLEHRP